MLTDEAVHLPATLDTVQGISTAVNRGLLDLVDQKTIETASQQVSAALGLGGRVWLTADLHFCHANIIRYYDRPHFDVDSMNEALLQLLGKGETR